MNALWCFLLVMGLLAEASSEYNFTLNIAARCKEHFCRNGYSYDTMYRVIPEKQNLKPGIEFEMHLAILAASNGHILLSPIADPGLQDSVYEIVVGGGANRFSELRRMRKRMSKTSVSTVDVLSPVEFHAFWIRVSDDGLVEFGREGEELAILSYTDADVLPINYFGFASWTGVEARFLYDCPVAGNNSSEDVDDSELVEPPLTPTQNLKANLLGNSSGLVAPDSAITVSLGVSIASVRYKAQESLMDTTIGIAMSWRDERMAWNPDQFNGTTDLRLRQGEIWKPQFYVDNSDSTGALDLQSQEPVYFLNSGVAVLHLQARVWTWCEDIDTILSSWPRDQYDCEIHIRPWAFHEQINIEIMEDKASENIENHSENPFVENEWQLLKISKTLDVVKTAYNNTCVGDTDEPLQNNLLVVKLTIRRKAHVYNLVFYTPLLAVIVFLLMSFWTEPLAMSRVWFYTGTIVVLCIAVSYMDMIVPSHTVPSVVLLYINVLFATSGSLLLHLVLMQPALQAFYDSHPIQACIACSSLRLLCCLPPMKSCESYDTFGEENPAFFEDPDSGIETIPRSRNMQEMQVEKNSVVTGGRLEVAEVIDKFLFTFFTVLFATLLACHY